MFTSSASSVNVNNANANLPRHDSEHENHQAHGQNLDSGSLNPANTGKAESHLSLAARERGLTMKELADLMGVGSYHLSQVAKGHRKLTNNMRDKIVAVLGECPAQGIVYRQCGVVQGGQTTYVRERARELGLPLREVADRAGISYGYLSQASRGQRNLSPKVQKQLEAVLQAPVKVETAEVGGVDPQALWERMDAHDISQNEVARRAGISSSMLSQIMNGKRTPSARVLRDLHAVLFAPSPSELVAPVELKVLGWKKDGRQGVVVKGAGGPRSNGQPGDGAIRTGGRMPWGAEVEFAYTTGYDSRGQVFVNHLVDERGCSVMLKQREPDRA